MRLYAGLIPHSVSIQGYEGVAGYLGPGFYPGVDFGINWVKEGPEMDVLMLFGGIVAEAFYCGWYNWQQSRVDMEWAKQIADKYGISFDDQLRIWEDAHGIIEGLGDILEKMANDLFEQKALGPEYLEKLLFELK
jgi:hypothetical protein